MSRLHVIRREFNGAERELLQNEGGEVYMTSEQIGLALGYSAEPSKKIQKLYERHMEELIAFKTGFKLTGPGGRQEVTAWKKEALYLFAMFARTETAKQFRIWLTRTCRDLESGDKVLVDRSVLVAHQDEQQRLLGMIGTAGSLLNEFVSFAARAMALKQHRMAQYPELFGIETPQAFFEFYEDELSLSGGAS